MLVMVLLVSLAASAGELSDCLKAKGEEQWRCIKRYSDEEYDKRPLPATADRAKMGRWEVAESKSPMDDSVTVSMSVAAADQIEHWPGTKSLPIFGIRCKNGNIEFLVITGTPLQVGEDGYRIVRMRIDSDTALPVAAMPGTDSNVFFLSYNPVNIVDLFGASQLRLELTPINTNPVVAVFDIRGADEAYKPVVHACKMDFPGRAKALQ